MADGQGRALGSGSIPDVPLRRKAEKQKHLVGIAGWVFLRGEKR